MAFTIYKQPLAITPVYNDVMFVVKDSNYTAKDYRYIFQITMLTSTGTDTFDLILYPKPFASSIAAAGHSMININKILQNYISYHYDSTSNFYSGTYSEIVSYSVAFYYKTAAVAKTVIAGSSTINGTAYNGVADFNSSINLATYIANYYPLTATPGNVLNIKNLNRAITLTDYSTLSFLRNIPATNDPYKYIITTDTGKVFTKTLTSSTSIINHIGVGPMNINSTTFTTVTPGGAQITSTDSSYTVQLTTSGGVDVYKPVKYSLICSKYDKYKIDYQSDNGGFGYVNFYLKHTKKIENKKLMYDKVLPYTYSNSDVGYSVINNTTLNSILLNTNWLTETEISEVENLLSSPVLFMTDNNGIITPVVIDSVKTEIQNAAQDKLVQYTIEFSYANKRNTIR